MSVKLELSSVNGLSTGVAEVRPILVRFIGGSLEDPNEFLARVVKGKLALDRFIAERFSSSELELFNEVFMLNLSKLTTFISVKVDIVNIKRSVGKRRSSSCSTSSKDEAFRSSSEGNVEFDFVILKSNKRKSKSSISAEPELKRNIESISRDAISSSSKRADITNHSIITSFLFSSLGKFVPDCEPFTIVLVNLLTTDFNGDFVNKNVTNVINPSKRTSCSIGVGKSWKFDLEINLVD